MKHCMWKTDCPHLNYQIVHLFQVKIFLVIELITTTINPIPFNEC